MENTRIIMAGRIVIGLRLNLLAEMRLPSFFLLSLIYFVKRGEMPPDTSSLLPLNGNNLFSRSTYG